jgi:serine/threonine protein kinase/Tfp pilus assembly protein PilF
MNTVAINGGSACRCCHHPIGPDDSHRGYCFDCLLLLALAPGSPSDEPGNGRFEPYEISTHADGSFVELGRGSMGITYQAVDTTLQFPVALKVIDFKVSGQEANRDRFLREARAAARLRHPHVASVLYYNVRPDGQCFYAMELVEGENLAERVRRSGPLVVTDALEVITQVAGALQAAEKYGLVHRDLKPANLMLVNGPAINAKVIDFGLAKMIGSQEPSDRITRDGFIGTPAFASPEQCDNGKIDQRSDYFSLGSTLFYLLTGAPPFKADQISELSEQMINRGPPVSRLKSLGIPAPVRKLVTSLLSASPDNRPRNGAELKEAIAKCRQAISKGRLINRKSILAIAASVSLLLPAAIFFVGQVLTGDRAGKSIAVLPFDNLSPEKDDSYFADGVQDDILTNLAKISDLRVISRASVQGYRNPATRPLPREIGQALNVRYLLNGSIRRDGSRIRVTAQLEEAQTGRQLWAERYDGQLTDVFAIQAELAESISRQLQAKLSSAEKDSLGDIPTRDLAGYELYLHAKELFENYDETTQGWEPLDSAVRLLNEAVARDPGFALAWCCLAKVHDYAYWYNEDHTDRRRAAAESALQKALGLRPDLGEIHLAAGLHLLVTTRDYAAIHRELEVARRTLPNSAKLFEMLASVESREGRWRDALGDYNRQSALDPKNVSLIIDLFRLYRYHRQYDDLRRLSQEQAVASANAQSIDFIKAVGQWEENGDTSALHFLLDEPAGPLRAIGRATMVKVVCALADRNFDGAEKIFRADPRQEFEAGERRFLSREAERGFIKKSAGNNDEAKVAFANARPLQVAYVEKWPDDPNPLMMLAYTDAAIGNKDEALSEARKAVTMRPISQDAVDGPPLAVDLAEVYLWAGEAELAIDQLQTLVQVPGALTCGDLAMPEWDPLRNEPRFQKLLSDLKPIPIVNR